MEQEIYYRYAELSVKRVVYILQLILLKQAMYVSLRSLVGRWSGVSVARMESFIELASAKMQPYLDLHSGVILVVSLK